MVTLLHNRNYVKSRISGLSAFLIAIVFACSFTALSVRQAHAVDCDEIRNRLKVHKSHKKAREESLQRRIRTFKESKREAFEEKHEFTHIKTLKKEKYSAALASSICLTEELYIKVEKPQDYNLPIIKDFYCPEIQAAFIEAYEKMVKDEEQIKITQNIIRDLESKIHNAERLIADNCPDSLSSESSFSAEDILNAVWTEYENQWTGKWKPIGNITRKNGACTREFSATWTRENKKGLKNYPTKWKAEKLTITINGNAVIVQRQDPENVGKYKGGAKCTYKGTINGKEASGGGGCGTWRADIDY